MKLSHLYHVIAAAEFGSLRAASRHLGIAQPAMSRSIHEIERELGVPLFERTKQGVLLTPTGEIFLRRALTVQSELRRAKEELRQIHGDMSGQVSVAMSALSTFSLMPSAIHDFRTQFPNSILKVTESFFQSVESKIIDGEIDFFVGPYRSEAVQSRFQVERLLDNNRVVVARKGHPLANQRSLHGLSEAHWVKQTILERASEADFERPFEQEHLALPKIVMYTNTTTATLLAVSHSDLLTIVPERMLNSPISADLFDIIHVEEPLPAAPICLVKRHSIPLTPLSEYFCDMIRRAACNV